MKAERLFEAIGAADAELVVRAEAPQKKKRKGWHALAACLVCVVGIGVAGSFFFGGMGGSAGGGTGDEVSSDGSHIFMSYGGPVLPLTAEGDTAGIAVTRHVDFDFSPYYPVEESYEDMGKTHTYTRWSSAALVRDSYVLTNTAADAGTLRLIYPYKGTMEQAAPTISVNGEMVDATACYGDYAGAFIGAWGSNHENETLNLASVESWEGVQDLLENGAYRAAALSREQVVLDQKVVVYAFTNASAPEIEDRNPTLAMSFEMDYSKTTVLTYGFNGQSRNEETGYRRCSFSVEEPGSKWADQPHFVAVIGEDIKGYTLQGYLDGGCDKGEELDGVTADVVRYETTLGILIDELLKTEDFNFTFETIHGEPIPTVYPREDYVNAIAEALVQYGPLAPEPMMRYEYGDLESVLYEATGFTRILYLAFDVTLAAGESITVEAAMSQEASIDFTGKNKDLHGYDMMTAVDSALSFTAQSASLSNYNAVEIINQNFGFDLAAGVDSVELDCNIPHYYMEIQRVWEE
ncbi:MAG: hypothetical protein IJC58_05080 [Oscillospiraceae bacterium]|nr:hypothetical protein [Oscillospiraceae bacterium]